MEPEYKITDVDYFENDALLWYNDQIHYFQFSDSECNLKSALEYLFLNGQITICKD